MGRVLILAGVALIVFGLLVTLGERAGSIRIGRLPGDVVYRGRNTTFYFPIVTCIVLSVLLTLISWLFRR